MPAPCETRKEGRQTPRVQDPLRRDTALARHLDTPMHVVELADRMSVRIDAEDAALIECLLMPAPVEVESPRMSKTPPTTVAGASALIDLVLREMQIDDAGLAPADPESGGIWPARHGRFTGDQRCWWLN